MKLLNKGIYLKVPTLEELSNTELLLGDSKTMEFNKKWGGTVSFPATKWEFFYDEYIDNPSRYYFHIYNLDGVFVGEVSSRFKESFNSYVLNIKIMYMFRGNKHAFDALEKFLEYIFETENVSRIVDNIGHDSTAGISLLKQFGFIEIDQTDEYLLLELKKEDF